MDMIEFPDMSVERSSNRESAQLDYIISPPNQGWKSIKSAYQSSNDVSQFLLSNVINYFIMRTASDGKTANDC